SADRRGGSIAGRRPDSFLPCDDVGVALHCRRWLARGIACSRSTQQRWPITRGTLRQLANDALRDIADSIDGTDHWLLANDHVIQEAFELRRLARVDQSRVCFLEHAE